MAIKESLALNRCGSLHAGRDQATIARSELYAGKSFINLQWPWFFGLRVDMTPIVEPECDIAVLLNFKDDNMNTASPGFGAMQTRWSAMVPSRRERRKLSAVVPGFKPA
jgi:hypothetical protein